jgi:hypothetical protein
VFFVTFLAKGKSMRTQTKVVVVLLATLFGTMILSRRGEAVTILPISGTTNNQFNGTVSPANTIDPSDLVAGAHGVSVGDNWLTGNLGVFNGGTWPAALDAVTISWDLGASYNLSSLHLWNHNEVGNTHRSIASAVVDVSEFANFASPTTITLASILQAPGTAGYLGTDYTLVATGRYVQFRNMTKHTHPGTGDTNQYIGISEIRFEGSLVPEPNSVIMLGLGIVGLSTMARRRRQASGR